MKQSTYNIIISLSVSILALLQVCHYLEDKPPKVKIEFIISDEKPSFYGKSPQEGLMEALEYYGVKHPQIVYAQAVLETGNFKSDACLINNNLFGLYDSRNKKYYEFDHWTNSVEAYVSMVQYKYKGDNDKPPNDYYRFLSDIGYAEDPHYINKVKRIVEQNDKRRSK